MADVAKGSVLLTPKFDNLTSSIQKQLDGAFGKLGSTTGRAGKKAGTALAGGVGSGLSAKMVAVGNIISSVLGSAWSAVSSSMGDAISRVDTLNQYPKVMQQLGFSTSEAEASIQKLSDGIEGLPTTLDGITSSAQRIALMTGDLDGATDTAIALNDAFLASGSSTADAERGLTQYVQMLSKGKPDAQSWYTLLETMGPALKTVASELGYTSTAMGGDLYTALQDGTLSFDDFNKALIECDTAAGGFAETAAAGSAGIQTSMQNAQTAVTKNLANIIDAFNGDGAISGFFDGVKEVVNDVGSAIVPVAEDLGSFAVEVGSALSSIDLGPLEKTVTALKNVPGFIASALKKGDALRNLIPPELAQAAEDVKGALSGLFDGSFSEVSGAAALVRDLARAFGEGLATAAQAVSPLMSGIGNAISGVVTWVQTIMPPLQNLASAVLPLIAPLLTTVSTVLGTVLSILGQVTAFLAPIIAQVINFAASLIATVTPAVMQIFTFIQLMMPVIQAVITAGLMAIQAVWSVVWPVLSTVVSTVFSIISGVISVVMGVINTLISAGMAVVEGDWEGAWDIVSSALDSAWDGIQSAVSGAIDALMTAVSGIKDKVTGAFSGAASWLSSAGSDLIAGLIGGITSMADRAVSAAKGVVSDAVAAAKNLLGIASPSKVFREIGEYVDLGFAIGMERLSDRPVGAISDVAGDVLGAVRGVGASVAEAFAAEDAVSAISARAARATARRTASAAPYAEDAASARIVQNFTTKVVRSDADLYSAARILNHSALRAAQGV